MLSSVAITKIPMKGIHEIILDMNNYCGVMTWRFIRMSSVIDELLAFDCLNVMELFCTQP